MTAEELGNLADESLRHELIKGELLTMPLPKYEHMRVATNLTMILGQHVKANQPILVEVIVRDGITRDVKFRRVQIFEDDLR